MLTVYVSANGNAFSTDVEALEDEQKPLEVMDLDHLYNVLATYQVKLLRFPHIVEHMQAIMDEIGEL